MKTKLTNEEKAREIADCCPNCTFSCGDRLNCKTESTYNKLLQMAKWKDEQFKEILQALPKSVKNLIVELSDIKL